MVSGMPFTCQYTVYLHVCGTAQYQFPATPHSAEAESMQHLAPFVMKELKARGYTVAQHPVQLSQSRSENEDVNVYIAAKTKKAIELKAGLPQGDRSRVLYLSLHSNAYDGKYGTTGNDCTKFIAVIPQCEDRKAAAIGMAMADAIKKTAGYKGQAPNKVRGPPLQPDVLGIWLQGICFHNTSAIKSNYAQLVNSILNGHCDKYNTWAEWRDPRNAGIATIMLELGFHDTQCDVLWISSDATRKLIAKAIADALDAST